MSAKISTHSSNTWLTGWMRPCVSGPGATGSVTSARSDARRLASAAPSSAALRASSAAADPLLDAVDACPKALALLGRQRAELRHQLRRRGPSCRARRCARLRAAARSAAPAISREQLAPRAGRDYGLAATDVIWRDELPRIVILGLMPRIHRSARLGRQEATWILGDEPGDRDASAAADQAAAFSRLSSRPRRPGRRAP